MTIWLVSMVAVIVFIPVEGKAVKNTHDLGERITAAQGHIVCRIKSGCHIDAFNNFTRARSSFKADAW